MCKRELEITLIDAEPSFDGQQPIKVVTDSQGVSIEARGFGDCGSADGHGSPIFLELYQGSLRLLVWADINDEEPTHVINLDGAKEECRRPTEGTESRTPLQEGRQYFNMLTKTNPDTGELYTIKEAADAFGVEYARFRNLVAIWQPHTPACNTEENNE